jgi:hypothetical protein
VETQPVPGAASENQKSVELGGIHVPDKAEEVRTASAASQHEPKPTIITKPRHLFVSCAWFMDQYASVLSRNQSDGLNSAPYFTFLSPVQHQSLQRCDSSWNPFAVLESSSWNPFAGLKSKLKQPKQEYQGEIRKFVQVQKQPPQLTCSLFQSSWLVDWLHMVDPLPGFFCLLLLSGIEHECQPTLGFGSNLRLTCRKGNA